MLAFHREHSAVLTVAVRPFTYTVPYGVIEADGAEVRAIREKPQLQFLTNAGIYLLEPSVYDAIPSGEPFDMPDLIEALITRGQRVVSFPIIEYWLDIGQHADYERAQDDVRDGRLAR
jgi:NDP-sugar pyrophosphorylase family protein